MHLAWFIVCQKQLLFIPVCLSCSVCEDKHKHGLGQSAFAEATKLMMDLELNCAFCPFRLHFQTHPNHSDKYYWAHSSCFTSEHVLVHISELY